MNFWRCDKGADAAAAFDKAFTFEGSEGVARGHEADVMGLGELALGGDWVAGLKLAGIDALANDALNALIRRQRVWRARGEALDGSQSLLVRSHQRSEEHTSELQSQSNLVCRLLLEKT